MFPTNKTRIFPAARIRRRRDYTRWLPTFNWVFANYGGIGNLRSVAGQLVASARSLPRTQIPPLHGNGAGATGAKCAALYFAHCRSPLVARHNSTGTLFPGEENFPAAAAFAPDCVYNESRAPFGPRACLFSELFGTGNQLVSDFVLRADVFSSDGCTFLLMCSKIV
jgi:hypothetical protein